MPHLQLLGALPPISAGRLLSITADPLPVSILVAVLVLYLWGVARNNRLHPRHRWPIGRTLALLGGVLTTAAAILSVLGVYDDELFWVHMVQHLLLVMVAAGLFAVSSPIELLWRATSGAAHRAVTAALRSGPAKVAGHPVTAFLAYALVIPLAHLTVFMTLVLETATVHHAEHVLFVVVGYFFWRQILGKDPGAGRLHPALKSLYLFLAVPVDTFVGLTLSLENSEIFPREAALHRTWGPSLVADLHIGGVVMWVGGDVLMMLAFIPVVVQWVRLDERHAVRADRELVAYFPPPVHTGQPTAGFALGTAKRRKGG